MTTYVYYVNPAADASGDGTNDAKSSGDNSHAIQTLNAAITTYAGNETGSSAGTSGDTIIYRCSGDTGNWTDTTAVDVTGHTTGVNVIVEGYNGNYTGRQLGDAFDKTDCYALDQQNSNVPLTVSDTNVTVRYIQAEWNGSQDFQAVFEVNGTNCVIDSCRLYKNRSSAWRRAAINIQETGCTVKNTTCFCANTDTGENILNAGIYSNAKNAELYNNSIYGWYYGLSFNADEEGICQNNAISGAIADYNDDDGQAYDGTGTFSYNASQDTPPFENTANHVTMDATLTNEWTDAANGDFTVASNGANNNLWDGGTSGGNIPTVDINGTARSNYSIGAFEYVSAGGTTVTVPQANLTFSTTAPTVDVPAVGIDITPNHADLALSTEAPDVTRTDNRDLTVNHADLALSTEAPDVTQTANVALEVGAADLALTTEAPTAEATDNRAITVGHADLALTSEAPDVLATEAGTILVPQADLTLSSEAPSVEQTTNAAFTPAHADLTFSTTAPQVFAGQNIGISPDAASLLLSTVAPSLVVADNQAITIGGANLALSTAAPTVNQTTNASMSPAAADLTLGGFAPSVDYSGSIIWTPITEATTTWTAITEASTTWTEI